jgi:hypothetical protein
MRVSANVKSVAVRAMLVAGAVAALVVGYSPAQAQTVERQAGDAISAPVVYHTGQIHVDDDEWD